MGFPPSQWQRETPVRWELRSSKHTRLCPTTMAIFCGYKQVSGSAHSRGGDYARAQTSGIVGSTQESHRGLPRIPGQWKKEYRFQRTTGFQPPPHYVAMENCYVEDWLYILIWWLLFGWDFIFKNIYLFYLAVPSLSCSTWDLFFFFSVVVTQTIKNLPCRRGEFYPWVEKIPWRRKWQPTLVFLPGKSHGQYSTWGHKESDTTESFFHAESLVAAYEI